MTTKYNVSSDEFPYFDAVRRLELFLKRRRQQDRKSKTDLQIDETTSSSLTPSQESIADEGLMTFEKEYIISQLIDGLVEALTGLKGHEQGRLIAETEKQKDGTSWKHNLAYRTKDYRFEILKKLTDTGLHRWINDIQTFEYIFHVFEDQLDTELDNRREKKELLDI